MPETGKFAKSRDLFPIALGAEKFKVRGKPKMKGSLSSKGLTLLHHPTMEGRATCMGRGRREGLNSCFFEEASEWYLMHQSTHKGRALKASLSFLKVLSIGPARWVYVSNT